MSPLLIFAAFTVLVFLGGVAIGATYVRDVVDEIGQRRQCRPAPLPLARALYSSGSIDTTPAVWRKRQRIEVVDS